MFGPIGVYIPEVFPTRIRGTGTAFSYGFARIIGLGFPFVVVFIKETLGLIHYRIPLYPCYVDYHDIRILAVVSGDCWQRPGPDKCLSTYKIW